MMFLLDGTIRYSLIPLENPSEGILIGHFEDSVWENVCKFDTSYVLWEEFLTLSNDSHFYAPGQIHFQQFRLDLIKTKKVFQDSHQCRKDLQTFSTRVQCL